MAKNPEDYLKEPYSRILIPEEEGGFSAEILEFPGCFSGGDTLEEAMCNLDEAAKSWIEASLELGQEIPEPFANQGFGGKIALRLPKSLHKQAARLAERDGVSLNQFLVSAIAEHVGAEVLSDQLYEKIAKAMKREPVTIIIPPPSRTNAEETAQKYVLSSYILQPFTQSTVTQG
jgi:predicted RNase H-like HicB family nuclease